MGVESFGLSPQMLDEVSKELFAVSRQGIEIGIVVGGGNIFRGIKGAASGMDRAVADQMGMLATVINALALKDALLRSGVDARVMSAIDVGKIVEPFVREGAIEHLQAGRVVIFAAGTGNPFFTTDTAAALRALEIKADALLKATSVDGIYDKDPKSAPDAVYIPAITYQKVLEQGLKVMDATAIALSRDAALPVVVFNMRKPGNVVRAVLNQDIGSIISKGD